MAAINTNEPRVQIVLPLLADESNNVKVDQTEHVTINGRTTLIRRGVYVDVPVSVFCALKIKYPNL